MTNKKPSANEIEKQLAENYEVFCAMTFDDTKKGKFALLHNKELISIMDTRLDAYNMGMKMYEYQGNFSIQEIMPSPIDLGFMGYVLHTDSNPLAQTPT